MPLGSHDKFGKELEVFAKLNNSNVMTPLAYVLSIDTAYILYEYISNGSFYDVLHGSMLDWGSRYSIAIGVAQGLSFLKEGFYSMWCFFELMVAQISKVLWGRGERDFIDWSVFFEGTGTCVSRINKEIISLLDSLFFKILWFTFVL